MMQKAMAMLDVPHSEAVQAVQQSLDAQVQAWNSGDLEKAMTFYWNSPEMLWISKAGVERGYQEVLDMFRTDFADPSLMGTYTYEPLHIEHLSPEAVFYVFRWKIEKDDAILMGGVSSQLWKKVEGRWVATSEHAS
ncbi:YybH family protein [Pontibacter pamirensis]|uniref:YybH family protein n=1 Tax=Pontibacter pamirensis TaxID=2562824 RepID=UPI001F427976|nr:nuclear transport factor 2 family protein [Pontibacter pamirensis]